MADTTTREALATLMMKHGFATGHGDTHADLIAEFDWQLAELRAARQWQLIETAPRDGTTILIWDRYSTEPATGQWRERRGGKPAWYSVWDGELVIEHQDDFGTDYKTITVPLVWMPLPAAPGDV